MSGTMPAPRGSSRGRHRAPRRTDVPAAAPDSLEPTEIDECGVPSEPGDSPAHRVVGPEAPSRRAVGPEAPSHRVEVPGARRDRRRAARSGARPATRIARGGVAVGLTLAVGAFAIAPAVSGGGTGSSTSVEGVATEQASASATGPTAVDVQEREAAVVLAATTAQQASDVKAAAVASAVSGDTLTPLDAAISELATLMAATQAAQPALSELRGTAVTDVPVATDAALAATGTEATGTGAAGTASPAATATTEAGADVATDEGTEGTATTATDPADGTVVAGGSASEATDTPTASDAGASAATSPSATATAGTAEADDVTPADPVAARLSAAVDRVASLTAEVQVATLQSQEAAAAAAAAATAAEEARKEAQRASLDSYDNGRIPDSALCTLDFADGQQLRCDAAEALDALNVAFRAEFGTDLAITDSYRSYSAQVACRQQKGSLCATPGTSNHGNGTAVDLGGDAYAFGTDQHDWMLAHAAEYGWELPDWARANGSKPEPWHWEYVG